MQYERREGSTSREHTDFLQELLDWERDADLYANHWRGLPLWRLVRTDQFRLLTFEAGVRGRNNYNLPGIRGYLAYLISTLVSILHILRLRPYDYLMVGFPRRKRVGAEWLDTFFDPLGEFLSHERTLFVDKPFVGRHYPVPGWRRSVHYDWIRLVANTIAMFDRVAVPRDARGPIATLSVQVAERRRVASRVIERTIGRALIRFRVESALFRWVLRRVRPRSVFLANRWTNFSLINACKRHGVPVYELQHGAVNVDSFKFLTPHDERLDPTGFLLFGNYWRSYDWGLPADCVHVIGHRYIWQRRERARHDGDAIMLVSKPGKWKALAAWFDEIVARHPERQFLLKLHPQEVQGWPSRYPVGLRENVTVFDDPGDDLYDLFGHCAVVLGDDSTVMYEASFFGLKTGLLNYDHANPSAAIVFAGTHNFHELNTLDDVERLLVDPTRGVIENDNPFFAGFDEQRFRTLADG